jgi:hypothetical protein
MFHVFESLRKRIMKRPRREISTKSEDRERRAMSICKIA